MLGSLKLKLINLREKIKEKIKTIPSQYFKILPVILILLALPVTIVLVKSQTKTATLAQTDSKPDIIVVMVDDLGAIDERILNKLPNIKSLWLDGGLRFDNAYSETPLCCPGRATFLTGQNTRNHGVTYNKASLLNPKTTIAVALHQAGYWTIQTGKYLNNPQTLSDKIPNGWDRVAMLYDWNGNKSSRFWVQNNLVTKGYMDRFTADKSLDWLKLVPKDKPLFMWINPHAPHKANDPAPNYQPDIENKYLSDSRCSNISPWKPANYRWSPKPNGFPLVDICSSLLTVDDMVGALRAEATRQGRTPIWVFTSDNGMSWGSDGYPQKNVPQSTRFPLYITGPGITIGSTQALVSNIDLGPTIAVLAGTSMSWADGISFASLLNGQRSDFRSWMLEDHPLGGNDRAGGTTGKWWGIRTSEWSYVSWPKRGDLLFDLINDPWKLHNLVSSMPAKVAELKALLNTNPIPIPTPTPTPTPTPSPSPSESPSPSPSPTPSPTPISTNNAQFVSADVPLSMITGQQYSVSVTMKNVGTKTWTRYDGVDITTIYRLGSQNPQDNSTWGLSRMDVPNNVLPGDTVTFNFTVTAPSTPGFYNFQWRMLQEAAEWFGDYTENVIVNVDAAPPPESVFIDDE